MGLRGGETRDWVAYGVAPGVTAGVGTFAVAGGAVGDGDAATTLADAVGDTGPDACAALTWSACCSARALLHAARTAAASASIAPKRTRLDVRERKISCHIQDLGG